MMRVLLLALLACLLLGGRAEAGCPPLPYVFVPGTTADANQVNANFNAVTACAGTGSITVANLTALRAACTSTTGCPAGHLVFLNGVIRLTDGVAGAPPLYFSVGSGACSTDDGASCVNSANGNQWDGVFPSGGADVREWGAKCDGTTNAATAITSAITAMALVDNSVLFPSTVCRSSSPIVVPRNVGIRMAAFYPGNPPTGSGLQCDNGVSPCLTFDGSGSPLGTSQVSNVTVIGQGTPPSGEIGVEFKAGYNVATTNLNVVNFDTCVLYTASLPANGGISYPGYNVNASKCKTHYLTFDGVAEPKFYGGRFGANGSGDYTAQDYVYITNSGCTAAGCGPNTITFVGTQFNSGSAAPACMVRFGAFAGGTQQPSFIKFVGVHAETPVGSGQTGVFCSDSTVTEITALSVSDSEFTPNDGLTPLFALNAATQLNQWRIIGNHFEGCHNATLAPNVASGFSDVVFADNFGCGQFNITASPSGSNTLTSQGNEWGSLAMSGAWLQLRLADHYTTTTFTDTATGNVYMTGSPWQPWTPTLTFGSNTGWAATTAGQYRRIETGGFESQYSFTVTAVGTQNGASATLAGMPLTCLTGISGSDIPTVSQLTGTPALPSAHFSNDNVIHLVQLVANNMAPLTDANFANGNAMNGLVRCAQAQ